MSRDLGQASQEYARAAAGGLRRELMRRLLPPVLEAEAAAKSNATTSPRVRGGTLRRSIAARLDEEGSAVVASLSAGKDGSAAERYARTQEEGETIRPRNGRFLAIPTGHATTKAGVSRFASARDVPGLRFVATRGGAGGMLVRDVKSKRGKDLRPEVVFFLVRQVTVPATRFIGRAMDGLRERGAAAAREAMATALGGDVSNAH